MPPKKQAFFNLFKAAGRLHETIFMGILSLFCLGLSIFRCVYSGTKLFVFLNWNLFLAGIPWIVTSLTVVTKGIQKSKIAVFILLGFWLLFFPNAPYILTDLIHLRIVSSMPVWFDLILILSFAWAGLLFGFLSLWDIEYILGKRIKQSSITVISTVLLFIGSFGVYIGRYLRWNSWDLLTKPFRLFYDLRERFTNPMEHQSTWGMTLFMGLFLNIVYWSFRLVRKKTPPPAEGRGPLRP
jgi:uncharacterized membrane protein